MLQKQIFVVRYFKKQRSYEDKKMSPIERSGNAIYAAIHSYQEHSHVPGYRFFTVGEISEISGYSVPTVRERLSYLVEAGYIFIVHQSERFAVYGCKAREE